MFSSWLERRRARLQAQMQALDDARYDDLVELLDDEVDDPPPKPDTERDRAEYREVLEAGERLTQRLSELRGSILAELKGVERRQGRIIPDEGRSRRGGALDGYV